MNNNNFVLYLHIAPNGKKYFGITGMKPEKRWVNGYGYKRQEHFWNAIQLYGWDNMQHIVLADDLTREEACLFEKAMIAIYNTNNPDYGYNETDGGDHFKHSERTKQIISESLKGKRIGKNNPMYGKTGSDNPVSKTVICITTGHCFGSIREAGRHYKTTFQNISSCCNGKRNYSGKLPDGTKLTWKFISDLPRPQLTDSDKVHLRDLLDKYGRASA